MVTNPLVTIILTSYNQVLFVKDALESVRVQDYTNIELIVVDNGSSDNSPAVIKYWFEKNIINFPYTCIFREKPLPYCKSFNSAFSSARGKYLIDLSGDDMLSRDHISLSVAKLQDYLGSACCFSDVLLIKKRGRKRTFYKRSPSGKLKQKVRMGDIYKDIVKKYVLPSASLVFDADIFRKEGGYDEELVYEDFDIMVRLARKYQFVFTNHIGVKKRIHPKSFSASQYKAKNSLMLPSTLKVCQKIHKMNRSSKEKRALLFRVMHEAKHALWSANFEMAKGFIDLADELNPKAAKLNWYKKWLKNRWDFSGLYVFLKKS